MTAPAAITIHTALTLEDRDRIDGAKGHALRLLEVVVHVLNADEHVDGAHVDEAALLDILDIIREDLTLITATLSVADTRRDGEAAPYVWKCEEPSITKPRGTR